MPGSKIRSNSHAAHHPSSPTKFPCKCKSPRQINVNISCEGTTSTSKIQTSSCLIYLNLQDIDRARCRTLNEKPICSNVCPNVTPRDLLLLTKNSTNTKIEELPQIQFATYSRNGTYSRFAMIPAVRVEPLLPPHPTSITLHSNEEMSSHYH